MREAGPLRGRTVVVTRPEHQSGGMLEALRELGAEAIALPAIEIRPRADTSQLDRALRDIDSYHWLVFTSVNGVRITLDRYAELQLDPARLNLPNLAAIGPATARELRDRGLQPDFIPDAFIAEEVAAGIPNVEGTSILLPRAGGARQVLPESLRARGARVDEIQIYEAVRASLDPGPIKRLQAGVDVITFTSPSTAENFYELILDADLDPVNLPGDPLVACIGPITQAAAHSLGFPTGLVAERYTSQGLIEALVEYFSQDGSNGS